MMGKHMARWVLFWLSFCAIPFCSFGDSPPVDVNPTNPANSWGTNVYNLSVQIDNDLQYDVVPMSLEVGVARGLGGGMFVPIDQLGDTNSLGPMMDFLSMEYSVIYDAVFTPGFAENTETLWSNWMEAFDRPMPSSWVSPSSLWAQVYGDMGGNRSNTIKTIEAALGVNDLTRNLSVVDQTFNHASNNLWSTQDHPPVWELSNLYIGIGDTNGFTFPIISKATSDAMIPFSRGIHKLTTVAVSIITAFTVLYMFICIIRPDSSPSDALQFFFIQRSK